MTSDEEAHFIALWQQEIEVATIAQRLGIPLGTVKLRAKALVSQGKIQPRPRGGAYPRQKALAREGEHARVSADTPPLQYLPPSQGELSPILQEILQELRHVTGALVIRLSGGSRCTGTSTCLRGCASVLKPWPLPVQTWPGDCGSPSFLVRTMISRAASLMVHPLSSRARGLADQRRR